MSGLKSNDHKTEDVEFCKRILPFGAVLRGAIARFLPASLISLAGFLAVLDVPLNDRAARPVLLWGLTMAVALTAGYLAGLEVLRRIFPPVANIDGWRSLVAGLMSPIPFYLVGSLESPLGYFPALAWMALGGVLLAVVTFFGRLTVTRARECTRESPVMTGRHFLQTPPNHPLHRTRD